MLAAEARVRPLRPSRCRRPDQPVQELQPVQQLQDVQPQPEAVVVVSWQQGLQQELATKSGKMIPCEPVVV